MGRAGRLTMVLTAAAGVFLALSPAQAVHLVKFQSGKTMEVQLCGEQGDQVCMQSEMGTLWMPRSSIVSMEEIVEEEAVITESTEPVLGTTTVLTGTDGTAEPALGQEETPEQRRARIYAQYKNKKVFLLKKKQQLHKRMKEDAFAKREASAVSAQWQIRGLNEELRQMDDKVRALFGGTLPPDWYDPERANIDPERIKALDAERARREKRKRAALEIPSGAPSSPASEPASSAMSEKEQKRHLLELKRTLRASIGEMESRNRDQAAQALEERLLYVEALGERPVAGP